MFVKEKLLVLEINPNNWWTNLPSDERQQLTSYKGVQYINNFWPYIENYRELFEIKDWVVDYISLPEVLQYYKKIKIPSNDNLCLVLMTKNITINKYEKFNFLGFDIVKLYEHGDPMFFSSIINELRPNGNEFIKKFTEELNQYYLFHEYNTCKEYLEKREEAITNNIKDYLEYGIRSSDFVILQIYCYIDK